MRILFSAWSIDPYLTTSARYEAFRELGHELETVALDPSAPPAPRLLRSLEHWTWLSPRVFALNRRLLETARRQRPDLIWIEKGTYVWPDTLRALKRETGAPIVYHNTDDWHATTRLQKMHWRHLLRGLPLYDLYVTSNLYNVHEFERAGFVPVHHMELAANPYLPEPEALSDQERRRLGGPVGFIGHWEPETERLLLHLARNGIELKVYGGGWEKARAAGELGEALQHRGVWGQEYANAIAAFDIHLGIVSKWNRNHTASRTFQMPAFGAFMIHERNEVVRKLFEEGVEIELFGDADELLEKCRHYLAHPDERRRIGEGGRRRCVESGYFETDRVRELLPALEKRVRGA